METSKRKKKEEKEERKEEEETKHKDVCGIEKGILGKKNERVRVARRALRLGDCMAIAVVCFLLTACAYTTHTPPSSGTEKER
jgi:HSP90 family molecular chaperone